MYLLKIRNIRTTRMGITRTTRMATIRISIIGTTAAATCDDCATATYTDPRKAMVIGTSSSARKVSGFLVAMVGTRLCAAGANTTPALSWT